ncbi:ImmA/IrrE family metallo-endopeptidase [Roseomonas aerophila]|uniref:ImmA/IrrE family metallo-endopeptidase n=1 Tax=Teichococcus aerophilus TaxID=1224513 RepID=A0ABR7RTC8_9PROT|nr:XRE family transcriptional regulator [Pseudoroseomonas aerophila]MBC9209588.1 ImmA/IrrE family metallo-endopeptidase [Pseudoroseomonas aerophila]
MAQAAQINPDILAWARETAGLSLEEAAGKLGLTSTAKATAAEKLAQVERGERPVTLAQLEKAAAAYRRPLVIFYLSSPPTRAERGEDYRTVTGSRPRDDAMLDALIRDVRTRQQLLREVLLDDEDIQPLSFVASCQMTDGAQYVANKIRDTLGVNPTEQRRARDASALFTLLRKAAERVGIYVLLLGDLGSHHSDIGEDVFRGVALADEIAPFVVINDNDATTARSFSLLHELAHIWIGASGVSGPVKGFSRNAVERFCNEVAGAFLLPAEAINLLSEAQGADFELALSLTDDVARRWNVSQGVVAYRLLLNGWIDEAIAARLFEAFAARWRIQKARERQLRGPDDSGPSYYVVRRARLGERLLDTVRRALQGDVLTHTKAARILGVSATSVEKLLKERPRAA